MKSVIDISIKSFNKVIKTEKDLIKFLNVEQRVEEKIDGVKIILFLKSEASPDKPYYENWLVAYKGNLLYPEEFEYNTNDEAKKSIGSSQYKFIWEHLKYVDVSKLPKGYQFFCEYLLKKPTLMSNYTKLYNLILLAYGKSSCKEVNGKLICDNTNFDFDFEERVKLANLLKINYPPIVFEGILYPTNNFEQGIKSDKLRFSYDQNKEQLQNSENDIKLYWKILNNIFLNTESEFGGKPEGFLFYNNSFPIVKIQQEYQLSKEERQKIKQKYKEDSLIKEAQYWVKIQKVAEQILDEIKLNAKDFSDYKRILLKLSNKIKSLKQDKINIKHSKKNWETIKDDIFLTVKMILIRQLADKWALVQGKFRIFTIAHYNIIKKALQKYDGVVVNIVSNKETYKTKELREEIIKECFKNEIKQGKLEIIHSRTGNLFTIINKTIREIFVIFAGTDRIPEYQNMINKMSKDIEVIEIPRTDNDISATKIIQNIEDEKYFKKNTPKCEWKYYNKIKQIYNKE